MQRTGFVRHCLDPEQAVWADTYIKREVGMQPGQRVHLRHHLQCHVKIVAVMLVCPAA